jgi:hypothetical protein
LTSLSIKNIIAKSSALTDTDVSLYSQINCEFQAVKMKTFIVLVFLAISCVNGDAGEQKCIKNYLQISNEPLSLNEASVCKKVVNKYTSKFNSSITSFLEEMFSVGLDRDCVLNGARNYNIDNLYLKGVLNHLNNQINDTEYKANVAKYKMKISESLMYMCIEEKEMGSTFDMSEYSEQQQAKDTPYALCRIKIGIEKNIIRAADYDINIQLMNAANCDDVYAELKEETFAVKSGTPFIIFGAPSDDAARCMHQKMITEKWNLKKQVFYGLATLNLSVSQRKELRQKDIKNSSAKHRGPLECLRDFNTLKQK